MYEETVDSIFKMICATKKINGREPVLFMCNRKISDALKVGAAKSGSPVMVKYINHRMQLYVFGIPFYLTEDFDLEPFIISTQPPAPTQIDR